MIQDIYDIEKHINVDYIQSILRHNIGKKIICFGGGTATDILMKKLLYQYDVYCFLDNNKQLHGTKLYDIEIKSPQILQELEKGSFIVLILSKFVTAIGEQLELMGLQKGKDYYDIYGEFSNYFRLKKIVDTVGDFEKMINQIPDGYLDTIPLKQSPKIGIVCIAETEVWFYICQCLILRYRGYEPTMIIDALPTFDDYVYFDGSSEVIGLYIEYIANLIKSKWSDFKVLKIDKNKEADLDEEDITMIQKYTPMVLKWFDARKEETFLEGNPKRNEIAENILMSVMKNIKYFFEDYKFDVISVFTGIHRHRWIYTYLGKKMRMRVATHDGSWNDVFIETEGAAGWAHDIYRVIEGEYFSDVEKIKHIELAKADFDKRRNSTVQDEGYNFQPVINSNIETEYGVIIALNIMWDAAALGLDSAFESDIDWLQKTLEYIMKNTEEKVMIKEHPAQIMDANYLYRDYSKDLPIIEKYPERIYYCHADSKINTYQYIEHCKLVLPYSSTLGLEAAMLGKPVVTHTKAYYSKFVDHADCESDYFSLISDYLLNNKNASYDMDNIYLAYIYQRNHTVNTEWTSWSYEWMKYDLETLNQLEGVDAIVDVIVKGIPAVYSNFKNNV